MEIFLFLSVHVLADDSSAISLSDSVAYFFNRFLDANQSISFSLSPGRPFSLVFHRSRSFSAIFQDRGLDGLLTPLHYTDENLTRFAVFDSTFSVESITFTPQTPQNFSFSYFGFDYPGSIFITNRAPAHFSFWESFPKFKCMTTQTLLLVLNISDHYRVSSDRPVPGFSFNGPALVTREWASFTWPSIFHFTDLSCADRFSFAIQGQNSQNPIELSIPNRYESGTEPVLGPFSSEMDEWDSREIHILIGVSVVVLAVGGIAALIVLRCGCLSESRAARARSFTAAGNQDQMARPRLLGPPLIQICEESTGGGGSVGEEEMFVPPDPYRLNPESLYPNQAGVGTREEVESPYDRGIDGL
jgi:hypothetical protein